MQRRHGNDSVYRRIDHSERQHYLRHAGGDGVGGGREGHITYYYNFTGYFTGTMTVSGQAVAVIGTTGQSTSLQSTLGSGPLGGGTTHVNAEYEPLYITDTYNYRIVRIDDILGDNLRTVGSYGSGAKQFGLPMGIQGDACRIVELQVPGTASASAVHPSPEMLFIRTYIADTYDNRIVRMDDMNGTNLTVLGSNAGPISFINPYGVSVDTYGTIYIADSRDYRIAMSDDMLGTFFTTYNAFAPGLDSPTTIVPAPPPTPIGVPTLSATVLSFANTVVGMPSAPQTVTMTNIGSAPLEISSITTGADFTQTNTCGASVTAGESCTITITFVPTASGNRTGAITVNFTSGPARTIRAKGLGTLVSVSPLSLNFGNVNAGVGGTSLPITVSNPGSAPAAISSIRLSGSPVYRLKNGCSTSLAAGSSCTLTLWFFPQSAAIYNATVTVTDGSGTAQIVSATGTGVSN